MLDGRAASLENRSDALDGAAANLDARSDKLDGNVALLEIGFVPLDGHLGMPEALIAVPKRRTPPGSGALQRSHSKIVKNSR